MRDNPSGFVARTIVCISALVLLGLTLPAIASAQENDNAATNEPAVQEDAAAQEDVAADTPAPSLESEHGAQNNESFFGSQIEIAFRAQSLAVVLRTRMYGEHDYMLQNASPFFSRVFVRAGADIEISPAYAEGGIDIEIQPISIFNLRARYLVGYNFGAFHYLASFNHPDAVVRDDEWDELDPLEGGRRMRLIIEPTFQIAFGGLVVLNKFTYQYINFADHQFSGPWALTAQYDRMIRTGGDSLLNNLLFVGYKLWDPDGAGAGQFLLGPIYQWTRAVAAHRAEADIRAGTAIGQDKGFIQDSVNNKVVGNYRADRHRVGLMAVFVPSNNWGKLQAPHIILQGGFNVADSNGRQHHGFIQGALGFSLEKR